MKPWENNRNGDPRQLLHEAKIFETWAEEHRRDAEIYPETAAESLLAACHYAEVAADYRRWAEEQSNGDAL